MEFEWEIIHEFMSGDLAEETRRSKVLGGWLVDNYVRALNKISMNTIFIPDPNHDWEIE